MQRLFLLQNITLFVIYIILNKSCQFFCAKKAINKISLSNSKLFRPPYGKFKTKQAKQLQKSDYKIVMWDVLSFDWDVAVSQKECLDNIINSANEGSIIVMHDSLKAEQNLK